MDDDASGEATEHYDGSRLILLTRTSIFSDDRQMYCVVPLMKVDIIVCCLEASGSSYLEATAWVTRHVFTLFWLRRSAVQFRLKILPRLSQHRFELKWPPHVSEVEP